MKLMYIYIPTGLWHCNSHFNIDFSTLNSWLWTKKYQKCQNACNNEMI